jgi:hypothetical protein
MVFKSARARFLIQQPSRHPWTCYFSNQCDKLKNDCDPKCTPTHSTSCTLSQVQEQTKLPCTNDTRSVSPKRSQLQSNVDMNSFNICIARLCVISAVSFWRTWAHFSKAYSLRSWPIPDCMKPLNGINISAWLEQFICQASLHKRRTIWDNKAMNPCSTCFESVCNADCSVDILGEHQCGEGEEWWVGGG